MTDDIVARLRKLADAFDDDDISHDQGDWMRNAADEIEELRKAIYGISDLARAHYPSGLLWGAINHAVDVADEHYKNCNCGERY